MYTRLILVVLLLASSPAFAQEQSRRLVSLMDYLGSDYKNAVQDGKVLSQDEFEEMQEFSKRSLELWSQLKHADKADKAGVESDLKSLAQRVAEKADVRVIAGLTKSIKDKLIKAYGIPTHPKAFPTLASGKKLYVENCAQCHGETGKGDGPSRESMKPKEPLPADFTDPELMAGLFPFKAYNTVTFGVDGTAMASFAAFSDRQRWQVAFYVLSLRHSPKAAATGGKLFRSKKVTAELSTVARLATTPDGELLESLKPYAANDSEARQLLAYLRRGLLDGHSRRP